jgi:hypothetical protein
MFLLRGYQEDTSSKISPGKHLDLTLPVWRTGECLLHASRLARRLGTQTVDFSMTWTGLQGRELGVALSQMRHVMPGRTCAIGAFVAGAYLAGDLHHIALVVLGAVVALGPGQVAAAYIWRRRPWDTLITTRLWSYEQIDGAQDLNAMIRREDFVLACRALRRAKLSPAGGTRVPPLRDAPELDTKLIVGRSARWHPPDVPELYLQIRECLRAAKIRANVAGDEIVP